MPARFFCLLLLLSGTAEAMDTAEVLAHNRDMVGRWVNWVPAEWERDEAVSALSAALAAEGMDRLPENIHHWVCENICYDWDAFEAGTYATLSPSSVLAEGRGVCEGIANLVQALFLEAGVPCIKVWGAAVAPEQSWEDWDTARINHTWNEYYLAGRWVSLDCTMDLGGSYRGGVSSPGPWQSEYLEPEEAFFARTHLVLRRGEGQDSPDGWAMKEVTAAVDRSLVPLSLLCRYRDPVTEAEFLALLGREGGDGQYLTRLEAARLLAEGLKAEGTPPYTDTGHLPPAEQGILAALYARGVLRGSGGRFEPDRLLTRQEAIVIQTRR